MVHTVQSSDHERFGSSSLKRGGLNCDRGRRCSLVWFVANWAFQIRLWSWLVHSTELLRYSRHFTAFCKARRIFSSGKANYLLCFLLRQADWVDPVDSYNYKYLLVSALRKRTKSLLRGFKLEGIFTKQL